MKGSDENRASPMSAMDTGFRGTEIFKFPDSTGVSSLLLIPVANIEQCLRMSEFGLPDSCRFEQALHEGSPMGPS